jgi:hypothetical protein
MGRGMVQARSLWPLTAEVRVHFQASPCGIYGGRSGFGIGFLQVLRSSPVSIIPLVLHAQSSGYHRRYIISERL